MSFTNLDLLVNNVLIRKKKKWIVSRLPAHKIHTLEPTGLYTVL